MLWLFLDIVLGGCPKDVNTPAPKQAKGNVRVAWAILCFNISANNVNLPREGQEYGSVVVDQLLEVYTFVHTVPYIILIVLTAVLLLPRLSA